ncbi:MAG: O-methyltransferase [Bacteroidales bacterium]|nr:O-methyltransferase [Bacteroidales bacterium]
MPCSQNLADQYIRHMTTEEDKLLFDLNRETHLKVLQPRMISGHVQGKTLELLTKMIKPKTVLEIGTYTGYSAICMARGMDKDGVLHTIDKNDEIKNMARRYIQKAGLTPKIVLHTGDALQIIPTLQTTFDLVFIDGDKAEYPAYYKLVKDKVAPGGVIVADNVLWNGKVLNLAENRDPATLAVHSFNEMVRADAQMEQVILPIRDGLMLIVKTH